MNLRMAASLEQFDARLSTLPVAPATAIFVDAPCHIPMPYPVPLMETKGAKIMKRTFALILVALGGVVIGGLALARSRRAG